MKDPVRPDLVIGIVLWGDRYIDTFLKLALPSFLAPGNLPFCASCTPTTLVLLTDQVGSLRLQASNLIQKARDVCNIDIRVAITQKMREDANKYNVMATCHHSLVKSLQGRSTILSILSPDCILSDGCLRAALLKIFMGYKAVLVAGPRASLQGVLHELDDALLQTVPLVLSPRKLVAILCRNFHPISESLFYSTRSFSTMPSCLYWQVSSLSFVAKYFHLHPLMVLIQPEVKFADKHAGTVDSVLIDEARVSSSECYVCEQSDEMTVVEITDEHAMHIPRVRRWFKAPFIFRWAGQWATKRHIETFLDYTFSFIGDERQNSETSAPVKLNCGLLTLLLRARLVMIK